MYRILICDDNTAQATLLQQLVSQLVDERTAVLICPSVDRLIQYLQEPFSPSIVLMDIELGPNLCGIDVIKQLRPEKSGVQVIYVTGHIEYCTQVYETEHVSFLVKPVQLQDLCTALNRATAKIFRHAREGIAIKINTEIHFLPFSRLRFLEGVGRKLRFACEEQVYESYACLKDIMEHLDSRFYQCHKSFVVNLDWVASCDSRDYVLTTGEHIPISNRYRSNAKKRFLHHLGQSVFL